MKCSVCGATMSSNARFCGNCGSLLTRCESTSDPSEKGRLDETDIEVNDYAVSSNAGATQDAVRQALESSYVRSRLAVDELHEAENDVAYLSMAYSEAENRAKRMSVVGPLLTLMIAPTIATMLSPNGDIQALALLFTSLITLAGVWGVWGLWTLGKEKDLLFFGNTVVFLILFAIVAAIGILIGIPYFIKQWKNVKQLSLQYQDACANLAKKQKRVQDMAMPNQRLY